MYNVRTTNLNMTEEKQSGKNCSVIQTQIKHFIFMYKI